MTQKHTPTPWVDTGTNQISSMKGKTGKAHTIAIVTTNFDEASSAKEAGAIADGNTAFIAKACNRDEHFDELVEVIKNLIASAETANQVWCETHEVGLISQSRLDHARAVLAKVQS